jgi:hypothetical protein
MKRPAPNPENLKSFPRQDYSEEKLGHLISFRMFESVDKVVRNLPDRSAWLRRVTAEAAQRELMKDGEV